MSLVKPESAILTLIHHDPRVCFVFDLGAKNFSYANPAFYTYFQTKAEGLKAERIQKMIGKEDRARVEKIFCALEPGVMQQLDFSLKLPDGVLHFVELSITLDVQDSGRLVTGFLQDVTIQKQKEVTDKDLRAEKELRRRTLRHDIAGTLGFIPTFTHLLLKKSESLEDPQIPVLLSSIESISKETLTKIKEYMSEEAN